MPSEYASRTISAGNFFVTASSCTLAGSRRARSLERRIRSWTIL